MQLNYNFLAVDIPVRVGAGGRYRPVFEKPCQSGKCSKIICKYSGKNETETVQNYKTSYQESYV